MSATPVTVTVRAEFQSDDVKTSCEALSLVWPLPIEVEITPSVVSEDFIVIVTLSEEGALERLTVKVAVFKFSSVSPEIEET